MTLTIPDSSIKPYFLRAFYMWCCDHNLTPHVVIFVNDQVKLPRQYCLDDTITLNIDPSACVNLIIDEVGLSLTTRFSGISHAILIPVENIMSIFARETGQSITFLPDNKQDQLSVTQKNEVTNKTAKSDTHKKKMQNLKKTKLPILRIIK